MFKRKGFLQRFSFLFALSCIVFILLLNCQDSGRKALAPVNDALLVVQGIVRFENNNPVQGAEVDGEIILADAIAKVQEQWLKARYAVPGKKKSSRAKTIEPLKLQAHQRIKAQTDANGNFSMQLERPNVPARLLFRVSFKRQGEPETNNAIWKDIADTPVQDVGNILIVDPATNQMNLANGTAQTADGSIKVTQLPAEVDKIYAKAFSPDAVPDIFPGLDFAEMGKIPLNSSMFLWMEALDKDGNPIDKLSNVVTVRSKVEKSQWPDLEDIFPGTDRIQVPMYLYNEETDLWEELSQPGWLEDALGTVLPEDANSAILDGSFAGEIYATYITDHFSWMNVDYAYLGPWTLSRLDSSKRNTDILYRATKLAQTIFRSKWGNNAFKDVNKPGITLNEEVKDGGASEFKTKDLGKDTYGQTTSKDFKELLYLNEKIWQTADTKKLETIFILAVTILHETAHWKHDVKKYDGVYTDEGDVDGEAGLRIEKNLFGTTVWGAELPLPADKGISIGKSDGQVITQDQLKDLTNPDWWKKNDENNAFSEEFWKKYWGLTGQEQKKFRAIEMKITMAETNYELGVPIPITVEYKNVSGEPVEIVQETILEGYPLYFSILDEEQKQVPFVGPKAKQNVTYQNIAPDQTITKVVDITQDNTRATTYYNFTKGGAYTIKAFYAPYFGLPLLESNILNFTIASGGTLQGNVTSATTGLPIEGALVKALQNGNVISQKTTPQDGTYTMNLPSGTYILETSASGYLKNTQENIVVIKDQTTTANASLSPLLATGEIRLVLKWGAYPADLDSHLWLPITKAYHVYYDREGSLTSCPFASLDNDVVEGYGPETMTIHYNKERYPGTYYYAVFDYDETGEITASNATVEVYDSTGLITTLRIPTTGTGGWWNVLQINGETGQITEINTIGDDPAPYADTASGCGEERKKK